MTQMTEQQKELFYDGFITCLLETESDDSGDSFCQGEYELASITKKNLRHYCDAWCDSNANDLRHYVEKCSVPGGADHVAYAYAGQDFLLTSNGHGVDFSDRDIDDEVASRLVCSAKANYDEPPKDVSIEYLGYDEEDEDKHCWQVGRLRPTSKFVKGSRLTATMVAWQISDYKTPELLGPKFTAYVGDDGLVYVSGFEN